MRTVLVTGGAGFIGSNFIHLVLQQRPDCRVVNLDSLTYAGNLDNLQDVSDHPNYRFVHGSITDKDVVADILASEDFDTIVNFAAESHVDRSILTPDLFIRTNVNGAVNLLNEARKKWETGKDRQGYPSYREGVRYLQVSTDEVYGSLGKSGLFTEQSPLSPNSPYSASKASADFMVRAYQETFKFPALITRCSNNYGPYQFPEKLIPLMISNASAGKSLPVYGDGMQIRDWLHVKDHCTAILTVLESGEPGEVYNVGGNNEKANIEIVRLILSVVGKSEDLIRHVEDRLGHDRRYAIDNTKITSQLGWKPSYTFEQGIRETIEWYLQNQKWLERVLSGAYRVHGQ